MSLYHPFQKINYITANKCSPDSLVAASGAHLFHFGLTTGDLQARWPVEDDQHETHADDTQDEQPKNTSENSLVTKKRKLKTDDDESLSIQSSEESIEIVAQREKGQRRKKKVVDEKLPNISHISATSDGKYIVALTAENKAVNVIEVARDRLRTLSQRCMPKRLCALVLSPDETTILVGDKFGDVYSLPLIIPEGFKSELPKKEVARMTFEPSATELTVHSKSNLEALRQQRNQRKLKPKKDEPNFEHKLLLGHVSLLTDLTITDVLTETGAKRQYILTSDRDEHIRVSRGLSQSHIIENYCHGHKEFISKLCIPPWKVEILIVGSGEPSLKVYYWRSGTLLQDAFDIDTVKIDILHWVEEAKPSRRVDRIAVSGIWPLDLAKNAECHASGILLVALEGLPIFLSFLVRDNILEHHQTVPLRGNLLDVTVDTSQSAVIVSLDTAHKQGSMREADGGHSDMAKPPFQAFALSTDRHQIEMEEPEMSWSSTSLMDPLIDVLSKINLPQIDIDVEENAGKRGQGQSQKDGRSTYSKLGEFLYGLENLRKKRGSDTTETEEPEDVDIAYDVSIARTVQEQNV